MAQLKIIFLVNLVQILLKVFHVLNQLSQPFVCLGGEIDDIMLVVHDLLFDAFQSNSEKDIDVSLVDWKFRYCKLFSVVLSSVPRTMWLNRVWVCAISQPNLASITALLSASSALEHPGLLE